MKKMVCLLAFIFVSLVVSPVFACSFLPPPPPGHENTNLAKIIVSSNGQFMMKMVPAYFKRDPQNRIIQTRAAFGEAFSIEPDGRLTSLWKVPLDFVSYR